MPKNILKLLLCLLLCVGGGWVSGLFTKAGLHVWYPTLLKSQLTPPPITFPIVWTFLYLLMGIAFYIILSSSARSRNLALYVFGLQLFFNFMWSFIFFYKQELWLALLDITLLWLFLLGTILLFFRLSKLAAGLLIPYFVWVSFAFYLNFFIAVHN